MLWGFSLQFWQLVVFWLWAASAVGGGVAVVAALGSSVISYYISEETQTAATRDIAGANATAGRANEAASQAHERSLKLAIELEQERIARLEIEARVQEQGAQVKGLMPRRLSDDQKKSIIDEASKKQSSILMLMDTNAADMKYLFAEVSGALQAAGWKVQTGQMTGIASPPPSGIGLLVSDTKNLSDAENILKAVFDNARIPFDVQENPMKNAPLELNKYNMNVVITTPTK